MNKALPQSLTSYDLLKTLAIVLMVVDHLGFYLFDNDPWFRVIGRLCVPIWFFLIGYARSKEVPLSVYIGAVLIVAGNILAGEYILPLCILVTLMLGRLYKEAWMRAVIKGGEAYAGLFFLFLTLYLPTEAFFEYGTIGFYFVIMGAIVRLKQDAPALYTEKMQKESRFFVGAAFVLYAVTEAVKFTSLSWAQFGTLIVGLFIVRYFLAGFRGQTMEATTRAVPGVAVKALQFTGRQTLWIYVVHLLVLKGLAIYLFADRFTPLDWGFFRPGFINFLFSVFGVQ